MAVAPANHLNLHSRSGLRARINANGAVRRFDCEAPQGQTICLPLFVGNELDGGPANLYLRRRGTPAE